MMPVDVTVKACPDYGSVGTVLPALLDSLGGMARFIKPGQSVLVKPNLLSDYAPEAAVTTHPEVVRGVVRLVKAAGARPWVADSPAMAAELQRVWEKTGMAAVCREEGVPLVNLEKEGSRGFEVDGIRFTIATPVLEADAIISVPKVKTHVLTGITGAIKNLYGTIPGLQKASFHKLYPYPQDFARLLLALYRQVRPVLSIADGVVGMEGNGPSAGVPLPLGYLAASADAVALDVVLCRTLGLQPEKVVHLAAARAGGLGPGEWSRIAVSGAELEAFKARPYRLPSTVPLEYVPQWLVKLVQPLIYHRPAFMEACIACGKCVRSCPVDALTLPPGARPVVDKERCIECCCCHEICPVHAVEMQPSPFFRVARQFTRGRRSR